MCASTTQTRKDARRLCSGQMLCFAWITTRRLVRGSLGLPWRQPHLADTFVVVIDHHQQPEDFADLLLSDPSTGATAELIYRLALAWGMADDIHADMVACLYCGLITDTGSFRFPFSHPQNPRHGRAFVGDRHGPQQGAQLDLRRLPPRPNPPHPTHWAKSSRSSRNTRAPL